VWCARLAEIESKMDFQTARLLRFGDFELDVRAGELRKHGVRIRLQDQSFQILRMLLERPGEVVLREEIRQKLWPNNTVVEFDHSINAAIKRLRNALLESAEEPRFIETLAKRGYRFAGQVTEETKENAKELPRIASEPTPAVDTGDLSGKTFSNYRVFERLGSGGMGVVYRAEDLKLGRQVALKFLHLPEDELPDSVTGRFEREARAAAALNHPHICTVHSVDHFAGQPVIVMELVEGETLESRLSRGLLPRDEAVALAIQIAGALADAHRKGIVHRDLKPANVMLTKSGVKVLDFGLAKMERPSVDGDHSIHKPGLVMGTLRYMSPEQAEGRETDARTDIFSFGVVLYEMMTGRCDARTIAPVDPPALDRMVRRCLAKDPDQRWQSALDLKANLEWLAETEPAPTTFVGAMKPGIDRRGWLGWSVAAIATLGLAALAFLQFREKPSSASPVRFQIQSPENTAPLLKLSPDGRKLAFLVAGRLWVHFLDSGESRDLTDGGGVVPFWSPDSRFIGYALPHKVLKIEATGGPPQMVAERGALWGGGTWNRDDVIVFAGRLAGIFRVPASGGVPVQVVAPDAAHQLFGPTFLPDGRHFVYTRTASDLTNGSIYIGSIDSKPEQQSSTPLAASDWQPEYAPSADPNMGHLLFVRAATLMAQPFDHHRMELRGKAVPVADHVRLVYDLIGLGAYASFSVSANDVLVFRQDGHRRLFQLTLFDRKGNTVGTVGEPAAFVGQSSVSPDGKRVALVIPDFTESPKTGDIWISDLSRGFRSRLTFGPGSSLYPQWSADGKRVAFVRNGKIYSKAADGTSEEEALPLTTPNMQPTSLSQDGRYLLYDVSAGQSGTDIWVQPLQAGSKPFPFLNTPANEHLGAFSPDGRWIAYRSNETGVMEIYVRPFPPSNAGKWLISKGGSLTGPRWRNDGKELGYMAPDGSVMAVPITVNPVFQPGKPEALFKISLKALSLGSLPDRSRFLMAIPIDAAERPEPFTVVLNWRTGLKE